MLIPVAVPQGTMNQQSHCSSKDVHLHSNRSSLFLTSNNTETYALKEQKQHNLYDLSYSKPHPFQDNNHHTSLSHPEE